MKEKNPAPLKNQLIRENLLNLSNARETFIKVFNECSPFRNLGYTTEQEAYAKPVIALLEKEGSVESFKKSIFLGWESYNKVNTLYLYSYPSGFHLTGGREDGRKYKTSEERLIAIIFSTKPKVFINNHEAVVDIALLKQDSPLDNLDFVVRETLREHYLDRLKKQTLSTKIKSIYGNTESYEAAWIDEESKLEFVVQVREPLRRRRYQYIHVFRRLKTVQDAKNERYVPFGEKPISDEIKYRKILAEQKQKDHVVFGKLIPARASYV